MALFYFSATGNTWWVSTTLKMELEALGHSVEMYSLENPELGKDGFVETVIGKAEHVLIGFPVYGSDVPANMKAFLSALPDGGGQKRFTAFCTQAAFSGDANVFFKHEVEAKGYRFRQAFQINMTTNFNVAMLPFSLSKPARGAKLEKIKAKAAAKLKTMAGFISGDRAYMEGQRFYQRWMGRMQRTMFRKKYKELTGKFQFFAERCVKCDACVKNCPTRTIALNTDAMEMTWGEGCLLCFRCYNFCPAQAINYGGKVGDPEAYQRYSGPVEHLKAADLKR